MVTMGSLRIHFPILEKMPHPHGTGTGVEIKPSPLWLAVSVVTKYLLIKSTSGFDTHHPRWSIPLQYECHEIFRAGAQWDHQGALSRCRRAS